MTITDTTLKTKDTKNRQTNHAAESNTFHSKISGNYNR
jgi:hypothetical protein